MASPGFVALVFEGDGAARGVDGRASVDQLPYPGGEAQLVAGAAAVKRRGLGQTGFAEAAEEVPSVPSAFAARLVV